ncbi:Protein Mo25 [Strongyloides ratti]|uniref:Protein Mo25 n=1 Tax=Strongyloides ratti TaxID=34506 RepID=A0A090L0F2_STRRB|nr:Protein Mo25 [Strongyloides ratti]CEF63161.1 Protein Mo25 [Strongyloides ratti]
MANIHCEVYEDGLSSKDQESLLSKLNQVKVMIFGNPGDDPHRKSVIKLIHSLNEKGITESMIINMPKMALECRKCSAEIIINLLQRRTNGMFPMAEFLATKPHLLSSLISGLASTDTAFICGNILRECLVFEKLTRVILFSKDFLKLFNMITMESFEIASNCLSLIKNILTSFKDTVSQFLEKNYEKFIHSYNEMLSKANYFTKRECLKLLSELLYSIKAPNFRQYYFYNVGNLKMIINDLSNGSNGIRYEAFHIFKILICSPDHSREILEYLEGNKTEIINIMNNFPHNYKNDGQFEEERKYLINYITNLKYKK